MVESVINGILAFGYCFVFVQFLRKSFEPGRFFIAVLFVIVILSYLERI